MHGQGEEDKELGDLEEEDGEDGDEEALEEEEHAVESPAQRETKSEFASRDSCSICLCLPFMGKSIVKDLGAVSRRAAPRVPLLTGAASLRHRYVLEKSRVLHHQSVDKKRCPECDGHSCKNI